MGLAALQSGYALPAIRQPHVLILIVALHYPPGHAQADFGEATVIIGGVEQKAHFFVLDLPHSDAGFVRAYPAATAEAWMDGCSASIAATHATPRSTAFSA